MKITRKQLRKIIMEEVEELSYEEIYEPIENAWAGGDNLQHNIDYPKEMSGNSNINYQEKLEIVKEATQLSRKQIKQMKDVAFSEVERKWPDAARYARSVTVRNSPVEPPYEDIHIFRVIVADGMSGSKRRFDVLVNDMISVEGSNEVFEY